MVRLGFLTMIELVAGLSVAGPLFIVSLEFFRSGQLPVAAAMLTLAVVGTFLPSFFLHRFLGRRTWVGRRLEALSRLKRRTLGRSEPGGSAEK